MNPLEFIQPWFAKANGAGVLDAALLADTMTFLPNDLLLKTDIASTAVSLEARSSFLDHRMMEFAARIPERLKLHLFKTKYLLKRPLKNLVPEENLRRRKMGFAVPIGYWFRGSMQPFLRENLLSDKAASRKLFNANTVRNVVADHVGHKADHSHRLWVALNARIMVSEIY